MPFQDFFTIIKKMIQNVFMFIEKVERGPGDRWMILGPRAYIPPIEVQILVKR